MSTISPSNPCQLDTVLTDQTADDTELDENEDEDVRDYPTEDEPVSGESQDELTLAKV